MTEIECVWSRIKEAARELGSRSELPNQGQAEAIVSDLAAQERANLPIEAREFLASELVALAREAQEKVAQ